MELQSAYCEGTSAESAGLQRDGVCLALNGGCILSWQPQSHPIPHCWAAVPAYPELSSHFVSSLQGHLRVRLSFFLFYFCFVLVFCFALKKSLVSLSGCPNITKVELQWMPQPGHVDVNVVVIYSGLIQVNAHTRRLCDPSDMPEWCPQISFLFFFLFFETELASARSQAPLYISLQWDFSCHFSQEELINIPQNTPTKRTRCLFALRRNRKYFCFCFLCVVLGDFLSRITISHPCSHQTVFRQFAHRRCTASASVSDGCQHDHGTRHQMADLGSVSWVSERHLLAVWRWV